MKVVNQDTDARKVEGDSSATTRDQDKRFLLRLGKPTSYMTFGLALVTSAISSVAVCIVW